MRISQHARRQWTSLCALLGLDGSEQKMRETVAAAQPEQTSGNWALFTRSVLYKPAKYYVSGGWRFVVRNEVMITAERVRPHENYGFHGKRKRKGGKHAITDDCCRCQAKRAA